MFRHHLVDLEEIEKHPKKIDFFGRSAWIARVGDRIVALADLCTHIGGPLEYENGQYVCKWHGACFDANGARENGPAPTKSHLMPIPIEVVDGRVEYVWRG